jgi:hypothetical protein
MEQSRIRQYADRLLNENRTAGTLADMQVQVEDAELNALRLNRELVNETTLRVRAERAKDLAVAELEAAKRQILELEEKVNARRGRKKGSGKGGAGTRSGGKVSDGVQRVDGRAAHERTDDPKPVDSGSDAGAGGSEVVRKSARSRGTAK